MNKMKILSAIGALAVLGGVTLAFQFADAQTQNILTRRLEGRWMIDKELTAKLDPAPGAINPSEVEFLNQPEVKQVLIKNYPRFANYNIYMTGTATMEGVRHMFALVNENENAHLVIFTPSRETPAVEPHHVHIGILPSRTTAKDLLFLGGDLARESAAVYGRIVK